MGTAIAILVFILCWCYPTWKILASSKTSVTKKTPYLLACGVCLLAPVIIMSVGSDGMIHNVDSFMVEISISAVLLLLGPSIVRSYYDKTNILL